MQSNSTHHIQKHILKVLTQHKWARFRDMRPPSVDSNLYNYHLKLLLKNRSIEKHPVKGYRLSTTGLRYVDRVNFEKFELTIQPKFLTKLILRNGKGQVLMWPKYRQPFIGTWSLPSGKVHYEDESIADAAYRELNYLSNDSVSLHHAGVLEVRTFILGDLITHTVEHLFTGAINRQNIKHPKVEWQDMTIPDKTEYSPGTAQAVKAVDKSRPFFYDKYDIDW